MDNFLYCYLSPFLVGLLTIAAGIVGFVIVVVFIFWGWDKISYKIKYNDRGFRRHSAAGDAARKIGNGFLNILMIVCVVMLGIIISFGAWQLGLDILKRIMCK